MNYLIINYQNSFNHFFVNSKKETKPKSFFFFFFIRLDIFLCCVIEIELYKYTRWGRCNYSQVTWWVLITSDFWKIVRIGLMGLRAMRGWTFWHMYVIFILGYKVGWVNWGKASERTSERANERTSERDRETECRMGQHKHAW